MERTYKVEDVLALMAGMAANKVALLEMPGLKLALSPDRVSPTAAAGNIVAPTNADAVKAVQAARIEAARQAEAKLAAQQQRTVAARRKAAGGIGGGLGNAIDTIYEASKTQGEPGQNAS